MLKDEAQIAAFWTGRFAEAAALGESLRGKVPAEHASRIETNYNFAVSKLQGR
jgi:hypothetical protein